METSIETSRNLALSFHSKLSAKFPLGSFLCIVIAISVDFEELLKMRAMPCHVLLQC